MSHFANATFKIESWDEKPIHEAEDQPKMSRVSARVTYRGDIEGEGLVEYLMTYQAGSFVLQHAGSYESGTAKSTLSVIPGSGTGDLASLRGYGEYAATEREAPLTLQYDIDGVEEDRETVLAAPSTLTAGI
jgi:hypothetical protein